jgi:hypothetical protein
VPRLICLPGPKLTGAVNFTLRNRVGQLGVKRCGIVETEIFHHQLLYRKIAGRFFGVVAENGNQAVACVNFLDEDGIFFGEIDVSAADPGARSAAFGRDVNLQTFQLHVFNGVALAQNIGETRGKAYALNLNEWSYVRPSFQPKSKIVDGDLRPREQINIKLAELDIALEAGPQIGLSSRSNLGFDQRGEGNKRDATEHYQDQESQQPSTHEPNTFPCRL